MGKVKKYLLSPITIRILTVGLNFIANVLINRSLGLSLKGQYTTILNYANFLQLFLNMGICYAYPLIRNKDGEESAKKTLLTIIWIQTIVFSIGSCAVYIIHAEIRTLMIVILSTVMICNSQIVFIALIDNIKKRNLFLLSSTVLFIICNAICILIVPGKLYIVVGVLIVRYLYELIVIVKVNHYNIFSLESLDKEKVVAILKIGLPTAVLAVLISCNYNIDIFMLNWMNSGDTQVGIYGVAYSLTNMLWIIPDAFKELIYNKSAREDNFTYVMKCIFANMGLCIAISLGFLLLGRWFLGVVYGQEYTVAFNVTLTLFVGVIPMVAFKLIHPIYVNKGKSGIVVMLLCIAVWANIISSWMLIPAYGAFGAAIASVISYAICGVLFFFKYKKDYGAKL